MKKWIGNLLGEGGKRVVNDKRIATLKKSLDAATREQKLSGLVRELENIIANVKDQYNYNPDIDSYFEKKIRCQQAFQVSLTLRAIDELAERWGDSLKIVDVGDSAGTHVTYLKSLRSGIRTISVNLQQAAVEKVQSKGHEAVQASAEGLGEIIPEADIVVSYQTLEHLMDPVGFLHGLSANMEVKRLVITVPYVKRSRVGLDYIRKSKKVTVSAENTHIFELSPGDWRLLALFSGWEVAHSEVYYQYPRRHYLRLTQPYWRRSDFEGFYGMILKKQKKWSERYLDWPD